MHHANFNDPLILHNCRVYLSLNKVFLSFFVDPRVSHQVTRHTYHSVYGKKKVDYYSMCDVIQRVRRVMSTGRQATIFVNNYVI